MNITKQFRLVQRKFVIIIVALSVLSVGLLTFVLYETNNIRFGGDVLPEELHSTVEGHSELVAYLEEEKESEAHFVTIASLVKEDQQEDLGRALLIASVPVIIAAGLVGYVIARYLLRPVKESYESQERFIQDAAHELRNPLAAMSLAIENAKRSKTGNQEFVKTMSRQTKRLIRINEDLLYLERRSPGDTINEVNLSNLLSDVLEDLQPSFTHKNLKLIQKIDPDIKMMIDTKDFIKLSRNIIENAIKYSKKNKKIEVKLTNDKDIELCVKDQGIGIPEKDLEHIGERFYRAKNASTIEGSGLGMAIVNKVLNVYDGKLSMVSKVGKGTTVKISF